MATPYTLLLELARFEAALIDERRWEEAAQLGRERAALIEQLPAEVPPEALAELEEALAIVEASADRAAAARAELQAELAHLAQGRRAVAAYSKSAG
jgi:hypothetical protein